MELIEYMRQYRTATVGVVFLLGSLVFFIYSNSPSHLQTLQDEKAGYRNIPSKNLVHTPYWYMTLGGCTYMELRPADLRQWAEKYENQVKNKPCTFFGYYHYGPGAWLGIIAIFLFLLNFLDLHVRKHETIEDGVMIQGDERQNKYIKMYSLTALIIIILEGAIISSFMVALMAWGENSSQNTLAENIVTAAAILCPTTYLAFVWYGWGLHRFNFKKIVLLTVLFPLPLVPFFLLFL